MIGNVIKYFRFTYDYVLWEISFANLTMLLATIPDHEPAEVPEDEKEAEPVKGTADMYELAQWLNKK